MVGRSQKPVRGSREARLEVHFQGGSYDLPPFDYSYDPRPSSFLLHAPVSFVAFLARSLIRELREKAKRKDENVIAEKLRTSRGPKNSLPDFGVW